MKIVRVRPNAKAIRRDERQLAAIRDLFRNDADERTVINLIGGYGEDGMDVEFIVGRLCESFPWAIELLDQIRSEVK